MLGCIHVGFKPRGTISFMWQKGLSPGVPRDIWWAEISPRLLCPQFKKTKARLMLRMRGEVSCFTEVRTGQGGV